MASNHQRCDFSFMLLFPGASEDLYVTNILYEREVTEREVTGAEVTELVWKLCLAHSASYEVSCTHSLCFFGGSSWAENSPAQIRGDQESSSFEILKTSLVLDIFKCGITERKML